MESNKEAVVSLESATEDLVNWIEEQCAHVMESNQALVDFRGVRYTHREIVKVAGGWGRQEQLVREVKLELASDLPSKYLFWRVKPEIERENPHAPEETNFLTGRPYGKYIPPREKIRLRLSLDADGRKL